MAKKSMQKLFWEKIDFVLYQTVSLPYQIVSMIKKRETCLYCGEKMESKSAKKKFCSALHKLYWHREKKRGTLEPHQMENVKLPVKSSSIKKEETKAVGVFEVEVEELPSYNDYLKIIPIAKSVAECQRLSDDINARSDFKDWQKKTLTGMCVTRSQHPDLN